MKLQPLALLMLLTGCPADPADPADPEACIDADQDGYGSGDERGECAYTGQDCDDGDATINPGAVEICNEVDDDCDGKMDPDSALGASTWWQDTDGDGYGDPDQAITACEPPDDFVDDDEDCDDGDNAVHPDAQEVCNGIDDDCDGAVDHQDDSVEDPLTWYLDEDGDGYGDAEYSTTACDQPSGYTADATDCDDGDPDTHPGAFDRTNDVDDDCDGDIDMVWLDDVDGALLGFEADDRLGSSLSRVGDVDGDGIADLLVGANDADAGANDSGAAYLWSSALLPSEGNGVGVNDALLVLTTADAGSSVGQDLDRLPDIDSDGIDDLLIGAEAWGGTGAAFLVPSSARGEQAIEDVAITTLVGESLTRTGQAVAGGDFDGDGAPDVLVGGWYHSDEAGIAWLVHDPAEGVLSLSEADTIFEGEGAGQAVGWEVAAAGDVDGDGLEDWLVAAPYAHSDEMGEVYLFTGDPRGTLDDGDATATMYGRYEYDHIGYAVEARADIDGDGYGDMLLAARDYGEDQGRVYVMLGPKSGSMCVCGGSAGSIIGDDDGDLLGTSMALGDVNGDGLADALFGAEGTDTAGADSGAAYLWLGPMGGGTRYAKDADARFFATDEHTKVGSSVALLPDLTGDGRDEMAFGARSDDSTGEDAGAVLLFLAPDVQW